jgi:hypothetical protein
MFDAAHTEVRHEIGRASLEGCAMPCWASLEGWILKYSIPIFCSKVLNRFLDNALIPDIFWKQIRIGIIAHFGNVWLLQERARK